MTTEPRTYLDLHVHSSEGSDDAGATVEGYLRWVESRRKLGFRIDGFVLTEHRRFDLSRDYSDLAAKYNAVVLRGVEVETDIGHVLVYGVTPEFLKHFDLTNIALPYAEVFKVAWETGGVAVGAHAGRPRIGAVEHYNESKVDLTPVRVLETLNGGSNDYENARAHDLARQHGIREIGASDGHFVSGLARCLTRFDHTVRTIDDLVAVLRDPASRYLPLRLEDTVEGAEIPARPGLDELTAMLPHTSGQGSLGGDAIEYDRSAVGREVHGGRLEVTAESIREYCEALEETNPLYLDPESAAKGAYGGIIAPPGLLQTAQLGPPPDPNLKFGNLGFHAGSRQEYFLPVRPGDVLEGWVSIKEVYEKTGRSGRMVFVVRQARFENQHGETVALLQNSFVQRELQAGGSDD